MADWAYFVTVQSPTAVTHAVGPLHFTSQKPELVIARGAGLEVLQVAEDNSRLEVVQELPLHGVVTMLLALPCKEGSGDMILLCTDKLQLRVLRWHPGLGVTAAACTLKEPIGRLTESNFLSAANGSRAGLHLYEGRIHIFDLAEVQSADVEMTESKPTEKTTSRAQGCLMNIPALEPTIDLLFLEGNPGNVNCSTLASLAAVDGKRQLTIATLEGDDLTPDVQSRRVTVQAAVSKMAQAPSPLEGVFLFGGGKVLHYSSSGELGTAWPGGPLEVTALTTMAGSPARWLLTGSDASLWLVIWEGQERAVSSSSSRDDVALESKLTVHCLGTATVATAVVCFPGDLAFLASRVSDSQLLRVHAARSPPSFELSGDQAPWTNFGPIYDVCVEDLDCHGQRQVLACSGSGRSGRLEVLRIGVGFQRLGSAEGFSTVLGLWSIRERVLVLSVPGGTRVLGLSPDGGELSERAAQGFCLEEETLLCCEGLWATDAVALQVTRSGVNAASVESLEPLATWVATDTRLQVAAPMAGGVLVATRTSELLLLQPKLIEGRCELQSLQLAQLKSTTACLHVSGDLLVVGLWAPSISIFRLNAEESFSACLATSHGLPDGTVPRSAVVAQLGGTRRLLVSFSDGRVGIWLLSETGDLHQRNFVTLCSQPTRLLLLKPGSSGDTGVLALGSRPTVIYGQQHSSHGQLSYACVNLRSVAHAALFGAATGATNCLAIVSEESLIVGMLDSIQRTHRRTVSLGVTPQRITFLPDASLIAVACTSALGPSSSVLCQDTEPETAGSIYFVGSRSLEPVHCLRLEPHEEVGALCSLVFEEDSRPLLAVGTAFVHGDEPEPLRGRLLIYSLTSKGAGAAASVVLLKAQEVGGAVNSLLPFNGKLLAAINNSVTLWQWASKDVEMKDLGASSSTSTPERDYDLLEVASWNKSVMVLFLEALGNRILVGDVMQSLLLIDYNPEERAFSEVAADENMTWLTAAAAVTEDLCICADDSTNLLMLRLSHAAEDVKLRGKKAQKSKLERAGQIHAGEFINRLLRASLVDQPVTVGENSSGLSCSSVVPTAQVCWVSVGGGIGLVIFFRGVNEFARLSLIQDAIAAEMTCFGDLSHSDFRDHIAQLAGHTPHKGFIDGDLVEQFLRMSATAQEAVVSRLNMVDTRVEDLQAEIEALARLH